MSLTFSNRLNMLFNQGAFLGCILGRKTNLQEAPLTPSYSTAQRRATTHENNTRARFWRQLAAFGLIPTFLSCRLSALPLRLPPLRRIATGRNGWLRIYRLQSDSRRVSLIWKKTAGRNLSNTPGRPRASWEGYLPSWLQRYVPSD